MKTTIRSLLLAGGVLSLAACGVVHPEAFDAAAVNPRIANSAPDKGTAFQRSLHQGYSSFGQWEYDQADFRDAVRYNARAQLSADGGQVDPVDPGTRAIAPEFRSELASARADMMRHLGNRTTLELMPGPAGAAQVYYDCWVEQQEEGHQPAHIAFCKKGYETAMAELGAPRPVAQAPAQPAAARPYVVFFDWNRATLTGASSTVIDQIAADMKKSGQSTLVIAGHADKSGLTPYNDALSQRRAEAVAAALAEKGVPRARTTVSSYGESRPMVDTADNVREAQNRRVEMLVR